MLSAWTSTPCRSITCRRCGPRMLPPPPSPLLAIGVPVTISGHRYYAVRVHVDHSDAAAADRHLAPWRLSLKCGARRAMADHTGARRTAHQHPEEVSAIAHPAFLASCLSLHERLHDP